MTTAPPPTSTTSPATRATRVSGRRGRDRRTTPECASPARRLHARAVRRVYRREGTRSTTSARARSRPRATSSLALRRSSWRATRLSSSRRVRGGGHALARALVAVHGAGAAARGGRVVAPGDRGAGRLGQLVQHALGPQAGLGEGGAPAGGDPGDPRGDEARDDEELGHRPRVSHPLIGTAPTRPAPTARPARCGSRTAGRPRPRRRPRSRRRSSPPPRRRRRRSARRCCPARACRG